MKYLSILTIALFTLFTSCSKKATLTSNDVDILHQQITSDIAILSDDKMEGREVGTKGEEMAAAYIADRFEDIGIMPFGDDKKSYYQFFSRKVGNDPHSLSTSTEMKTVKGRNVVGLIDNKAKHTIVIGAHYDHLGYGEEGSLYTGEKAIHNGADDNASGVAMMLYLAKALKQSNFKNNNYIFIAFSGEEKGLWGSNYFVKNSTNLPLEKMNYMVNMDMVGRMNKDRQLMVSGVGTSPLFTTVLDEENSYKIAIKKTESGVGPTDHTSFYLENIPVLSFFTGQHEDYHKPSDDMHLLNYGGMRDISKYIYDIIENLDNDGKLPFNKTKDESTDAPKFTVTLGVIPDYLYDGKGMRIDGVKEGKPAGLAGIIKGDIVLKMNDLEISDMMSYMKALASFKKGEKAKVLIKRGNEEMVKEVEF